MANLSVKVDAKGVRRKKLFFKLLWLVLILLLLLISVTYAILYVINQNGNFTIRLDKSAYEQEKLIVSPRSDFAFTTHKMVIPALEFMDNISESWLPSDIDNESDGPHNGNNYMAYTFYVKNNSEETLAYSVVINILSVMKDVDNAVRIKVYRNGNETVYAKRTPTGEIEMETTPFVNDDQVMNELVQEFTPGAVDKYTIIVWLEGDDPECINNIIGGEMKMEMIIGENTEKYER